MNFFKNLIQVIYSSSPISWPSFKPLAQILFEISCWQDFILIFSKGHNSRKGDNLEKKKYGQLFSMRNRYTKFQNANMHGSWQMDGWTHRRTHGQPKTNMRRQLLKKCMHSISTEVYINLTWKSCKLQPWDLKLNQIWMLVPCLQLLPETVSWESISFWKYQICHP